MNGFSMFFAGETLQNERINGGAFVGTDGLRFPHKLIPVSKNISAISFFFFWCSEFLYVFACLAYSAKINWIAVSPNLESFSCSCS